MSKNMSAKENLGGKKIKSNVYETESEGEEGD